MSRSTLMALAIAIAMIADPAIAQTNSGKRANPAFSQAESEIIHRNATLTLLVNDDPWVVRRFLDALADVEAHKSLMSRDGQINVPTEKPPESFDPDENPDVDRMQRASPEAVHDLFQLLKQAAAKKPATAK
jgi:hypothetical protein